MKQGKATKPPPVGCEFIGWLITWRPLSGEEVWSYDMHLYYTRAEATAAMRKYRDAKGEYDVIHDARIVKAFIEEWSRNTRK